MGPGPRPHSRGGQRRTNPHADAALSRRAALVLKTYGGRDRIARGRHQDLDISQQIDLHYGGEDDKMRRYCELLRDLFTDQLAWLNDRTHVRKITERNGRDSLALAATATSMASVNNGVPRERYDMDYSVNTDNP